MAAVAAGFGISKRTARKWLKRFEAEGPAGLENRSSRPTTVANRTGEPWLASIARLRREYRLASEDRVPSDRLLAASRDPVLDWWNDAYFAFDCSPAISFLTEATSSLPALIGEGDVALDEIHATMRFQRLRYGVTSRPPSRMVYDDNAERQTTNPREPGMLIGLARPQAT